MKIKEKAPEIPQQIYSYQELSNFHQDIQKYWSEPRTLTKDITYGSIAQKFNWEEMAVGLGVAKKIQHSSRKEGNKIIPLYIYQYDHEKFVQLNNKWNQYVEWRKKNDWITGKQNESLEQTAQEVNF